MCWPVWLRPLSRRLQGRGFDSWSGHVPGLGLGAYEKAADWCFSRIDDFFFFSLSALLYESNEKNVLRWKKKSCTHFTWHLSTCSFLCLGRFGISIFCRVILILGSISFPLSLWVLSLPSRQGPFKAWALADDLVDLLYGLSFTLALSPLASPSAFLLGMMVTVVGHTGWAGGCSSVWALVSLEVILTSFSGPS